MNLTGFDYLIFGVMIFFTFLGLVRGFIKELASLVNWVGSALLTVFLRPIVNEIISNKISSSLLSNLISSTIVFIIAIIALSILTSNIARAINTKFPLSINITLGTAFGFTKGFLISSLIFATILNLFGDTDDISSKKGPKWLQESETYKPLLFGSNIILPFADSFFGNIKEKYSKDNTIKDEEIEEDKENNLEDDKEDKFEKLRRYKKEYDKIDSLLNEIEKPKIHEEKGEENNNKTEPESDTEKDNGGYKKDQRDKLNHLIDIL